MRIFLTVVLLAGCGTDERGTMGPELLPGFEVEPPAEGQLQIATPILPEIAPGQDITLCTYLDYTAPADLDIVDYKGFQSDQGHHTILYGAAQTKPAGTHECTEDDMFNVRYLGGGGTDATVEAGVLPPGIAFRVRQGTQLMMVSHWINMTDVPVRAQAVYNLTAQAPSAAVEPGDLFTIVTTRISLESGRGTARAECLLGSDLSFFLIGGHAHEYATHVTISRQAPEGEPQVVYDTSWAPDLIFDTPLDQYTKEEPYQMQAGDRVIVDCEYENTTGAPLAFPTEMCVGFGYYFPATREIDCVDSVWPPGA
jgi:hypothetical protein